MMIPTRVLILATLLGILLDSTAMAAASIRVPGLGATTCKDVTKVGESGRRNKARRSELAGWAQGYLSGLLTFYTMQIASFGGAANNDDITIDYDSEGHWIWLVDHCQSNPSHNLAEAVMALFEDTITD